MFCVKCGQKINDDTVFCPNCGQSQTENSSSAAPQAAKYEEPAQAQTPAFNPQPQAPQVPQAQQFSNHPAAKSKKKRGCLTALIIFIIVLAVAGAGVYFLVPGLMKPYDLGIKSTKDAYTRAMEKLGITKDESPTKGAADDYKITYGAPHDVNAELTSEEVTAFLNENRPPYYAIKNVQVRVNDDGSIEAIGTLTTSYVFNNILGGQYTKKDAQSALPMLGLIPDTVNVYLKVSGSVMDNQAQDLDVQSVKVMGIPIPESLIRSSMSFINETFDSYLGRECDRVGAHVDRVTIEKGKLNFKGTLPSSVNRAQLGLS
jgi:hypothetical protein